MKKLIISVKLSKVLAKITSSVHQMELKLYEHHFYKTDSQEIDKLTESA
jgi:hypothetical protein